MNKVAILLGKTVIKVSRLFGNQGSALPGLIVEKIAPQFLAKMLNQIPQGIVIISGTNGKTSTTKAVSHILQNQDIRVFSNPTGSNFTRGIISTILDKSSWGGKLDYDIAVLELDEAFSRIFVKQVTPKFVTVLNVMRDQLDRYGEIDSTAAMLLETAQAATAGVILNQDDNRVEALSDVVSTPVNFFGAAPSLATELPNDDEMFSGKSRRKERLHENNVELVSYDHRVVTYSINGETYSVTLSMAGIHNAMNMASALATVLAINPSSDPSQICQELENLKPAWGRGEVVAVGKTSVTLSLVKNPAGFRQSMKSFENNNAESILFAINDRYADGRDISWLWDVDFTTINVETNLYVSGIRAYDMALRLEYDGKVVKNVNTSELQNLQQILHSEPKSLIIFCTYTAMQNIRKQLSKMSDIEAAIW